MSDRDIFACQECKRLFELVKESRKEVIPRHQWVDPEAAPRWGLCVSCYDKQQVFALVCERCKCLFTGVYVCGKLLRLDKVRRHDDIRNFMGRPFAWDVCKECRALEPGCSFSEFS